MDSIKRRERKYESNTNGEHQYGLGKYFLRKKHVYLEDKLSKKLDTPPIL